MPMLQVKWPEPLGPNPRVAIIGGGMSGLMCARELARLGIRCVATSSGPGTPPRLLLTVRSGTSTHLRAPAMPSW